MILLAELPKEHELRNRPMKEIDVCCRNNQQKNWRPIKTWMIGKATYNQLGPTWIEYNQFAIL